MTMIGAALLWVGWFGFNAGSALEANGTAALAMINTFVATAAAALAWMLAERMTKGKPSLLGGASGAVAGLVAVTPASGFAGPMGAIVLGLVAGFVCMFFCSTVKNAMGYDDALDVFGVHCIGGIIGAIGTGILAAPWLGGTGVFDYATGKIGDYDMVAQVITQAKTVRLDAGLVGGRIGHPLHDRQGARRPASRHRPGARGPRPRRSRRAGLQLLRVTCGEARAPSGLAAFSSTPLPRYVLLTPEAKASGAFFLGQHAERRPRRPSARAGAADARAPGRCSPRSAHSPALPRA